MSVGIKSYTHWIIVGLIIVVLMLAEYLLSSVYSLIPYNSWIYSLIYAIVVPGLVILQHITIETINWFGGDAASASEFYKSASIVIFGIVFLLMLLPWFFLKGRLNRSPEDQNYPVYWYFSAALLCLAIILASYVGITQIQVNTHNEQSIEASRNLDQLRSYMTYVAFDASEWLILPEEADGGGGTFRPENHESFSLEMLSSYDADHSVFELTIDGEPSDSTFTLVGTVINGSVNDDSKNQISLEVTPYNDSLFKFSNNL